MTNKGTSKIAVALGLPVKVAELLVFAQVVHDKMAASIALLPKPSPTLLVLQTDISTLASKEALVKARVPSAVNDRDAAQKALKIDLHNERAYVESVVNADPANAANIAEGAGMTLRKPTVVNKLPLAVKAEHWFHFLAFSPAIFHASSNP